MIYLSQALISVIGIAAFVLLIFGEKPIEAAVIIIATLLLRNVHHNPEAFIQFVDFDEMDKQNGVK